MPKTILYPTRATLPAYQKLLAYHNASSDELFLEPDEAYKNQYRVDLRYSTGQSIEVRHLTIFEFFCLYGKLKHLKAL